jgi:hypothetical protein
MKPNPNPDDLKFEEGKEYFDNVPLRLKELLRRRRMMDLDFLSINFNTGLVQGYDFDRDYSGIFEKNEMESIMVKRPIVTVKLVKYI